MPLKGVREEGAEDRLRAIQYINGDMETPQRRRAGYGGRTSKDCGRARMPVRIARVWMFERVTSQVASTGSVAVSAWDE